MGTLFDAQVARAAGASTERSLLPVVEKEVLHHDILRLMADAGFLKSLTFFGGTSLRLCHGSSRLSEDLDFKGGPSFTRALLDDLAPVLETGLLRKYGLEARVEEPRPKEGNTDTWTIRIVTRPASKSEKQQRIHIDVCTLTNYEREPRLLSNHYQIDLGTTGLIVQVQSRKETYTDKLLAFALRNRIRARDLWDIVWLKQSLADSTPVHLREKTAEHHRSPDEFLSAYDRHLNLLKTDPATRQQYLDEMGRFLPLRLLDTVRDPGFWAHTCLVLEEERERCQRDLAETGPRWTMS